MKIEKKNWKKIAIAIIWTLNILLLVLEHYQINRLKGLERELDGIIATKVVVTKNRPLGEQVLKASFSLYATSREPLLGWLEIENNLVTAAEKYGLENIIMSSPPEFTGSGDTFYLYPINISFAGKYADALRWIDTVENQFLYVDIVKITVEKDSSDKGVARENYSVVLRARMKKLNLEGTTEGRGARNLL